MKTKDEYFEELEKKIKSLIETTWNHSVNLIDITRWRDQFANDDNLELDEQLHAMYLLSHFNYFDQTALRELLKSVYRDLYRTPLIHQIRRANDDVLDAAFLNEQFLKAREKTRFLGVGNPSESGVHLLYYFRQENALPRNLFINSHEIFKRDASSSDVKSVIRSPEVEHYVYLDDLCGSGTQAKDYSKEIVAPLKAIKSDVKVAYFVLFATTDGLKAVKDLNCFDQVSAVFELDRSFKCLEAESRIFQPEQSPFMRERIKATCKKFGDRLWKQHPLGFKDGQLLIGFNHNTPDNTLPIFWCDEYTDWRPIFKRYHKDYG